MKLGEIIDRIEWSQTGTVTINKLNKYILKEMMEIKGLRVVATRTLRLAEVAIIFIKERITEKYGLYINTTTVIPINKTTTSY